MATVNTLTTDETLRVEHGVFGVAAQKLYEIVIIPNTGNYVKSLPSGAKKSIMF